MRVLFISQYFPYPLYNGASMKIYYLIKYLSTCNEIYFLSFAGSSDENYIPEIRPYCSYLDTVLYATPKSSLGKALGYGLKAISPLRFHSPEMYSKIREAVSRWKPDLVHADLPMMAQYVSAFRDIPKVISPNDAISLIALQMFQESLSPFSKWRWWALYKQRKNYEMKYFPRFDVCALVSEVDAIHLRSHCPKLDVRVIPLGIDLHHFSKSNSAVLKEEYPSIIFTGVMNRPQHVDATLYFTENIYPIIKTQFPGIRFYIVGRDPDPQIERLSIEDDSIVVTGEVEDTKPYLSCSTVYVSPVRLGSGIKTSILTAMAMSMPIVASSCSMAAIDVSNGEEVFIADKPKQFANLTIRLLRNSELRSKLATNARKLVEEKYSLETYGERYQELYEEIKWLYD